MVGGSRMDPVLGGISVQLQQHVKVVSDGVGTAKLVVTALRSLLGFLHVESVIGSPLASTVLSVAGGTHLG
jgi:hypothetical protein